MYPKRLVAGLYLGPYGKAYKESDRPVLFIDTLTSVSLLLHIGSSDVTSQSPRCRTARN